LCVEQVPLIDDVLDLFAVLSGTDQVYSLIGNNGRPIKMPERSNRAAWRGDYVRGDR
jgi:hypothetical protein